MKRILFIFSLIIFSSNLYFGQVACNGSGTFSEAAIQNYTGTYPGNFGNGTTGFARVCITAVTIGTAMCSGTAEHLRIMETDGTVLGTVTSATVLPVCFTSTVNNGQICVQDYCATGTNSYTLNWDTFTTVGGSTSACCTADASLCSDGIQNGCETGIDCGSVCPASCGVSCVDNILNNSETSIDCGGPNCPACGAACATYSSQTMNPAAGSIVNASVTDQTITSCVNITYNNSGNNWLHGVYVNTNSTGFVSSNASGATPEANISSMGTTYQWSNQTANFSSTNSGNSVTANGWFVETGALNGNPGNNLGWPVAASTNLGPFCFTTTVSCSGLNGDIAASINFAVTSDSYSGAWTNTNCGLESSSGASSLSYTLRCPVVLPIELLYFKGGTVGRRNKLIWATASQKDNDFFTVMKSTDGGVSWNELTRIQGRGNSSEKIEYEVFDEHPAQEITYYKLKQTDFDGTDTESNVLAILSSAYFHGLSIIPNPVGDLATVSFRSSEMANTEIMIFDISGKKVFSNLFITENGMNSYTIETNDIKPGMYFMELTNSFESQKIMFVKQ